MDALIHEKHSTTNNLNSGILVRFLAWSNIRVSYFQFTARNLKSRLQKWPPVSAGRKKNCPLWILQKSFKAQDPRLRDIHDLKSTTCIDSILNIIFNINIQTYWLPLFENLPNFKISLLLLTLKIRGNFCPMLFL